MTIQKTPLPLFVLMALTSIFVLPGTALLAQTGDPVLDLINRDEIERAETLLNQESASPRASALHGEIEYRRGRFEAAQSLYQEALKEDPKTARGHFGLGKLALAKLQVKEAIRRFDEAIRLDPKEPKYHLYASEAWGIEKNLERQRKHLAAFLELSPKDADRVREAEAGIEMIDALKGIDIGEVDAPLKPAPIRFHRSLNLLFTEVMVNGQGPFSFVIDTGASQTVFSESLGAKLGLESLTTTIIHGVGGLGKIESKIFRADEVKLGDITVRNLPVGTFNDPLVSAIADGIIGTSMLSDFVITVNYPANQLELSREAPPLEPGAEQIPAWFFNNLLLAPLDVNGQQRGNFLVDTGAVTTVLAHSMAARLGVTEDTPGAQLKSPMAGVGGIEGAVLQVPDVTMKTAKNSETFEKLISINLNSISKMLETELSGVLGFDFLSDYKLTIDYRKAEVRLSK